MRALLPSGDLDKGDEAESELGVVGGASEGEEDALHAECLRDGGAQKRAGELPIWQCSKAGADRKGRAVALVSGTGDRRKPERG